ncbi:hypothetical protein EZS27_023557 [termite gut metagenome]|uniref:Polymerase nucleotidyl transferase domain-containing protein n=1 Tax=termite gut metagenome TaxID=433724 RepID=A0A5J4R013_9ZZZZ
MFNSYLHSDPVYTGKFNDASDVDLLVSFEPLDFDDYADIYSQIVDLFEKIFHRLVDLLTDNHSKTPTSFVLLIKQRHF